MKSITARVAKLLTIILLLALSSCSGFFYHGDKYFYADPKKFDVDHRDINFEASDGTKLHAWMLLRKKDQKKKGTIVYFHGNAQNLSSHWLGLAWLTFHGYDVFIFDYRGFGKSEGKSHVKGIQQDAIAALNYGLKHHQKTKAKKFIVYGQSLGGSISVQGIFHANIKDKVDLLVLDSTHHSYQDIAFDKMKATWILWPFSPLAYLTFSERGASTKMIPNITPVPLLVIHGVQDVVVPYKFGKQIFELAKNPKTLWTIKDGRHTDVFHRHDRKHRPRFLAFLDKL